MFVREKVVAVRERTKEMLNNALQDEEKMQKVRRLPLNARAHDATNTPDGCEALFVWTLPRRRRDTRRRARPRGTVARSNAASIDAYRTAHRDASDRRGAPVERPTDAPEIPRRYERDADAY